MRNQFVFHQEWFDALRGAPAEVRLEVYEAITAYGLDGVLPTDLQPMAQLAFHFAKKTIDADNERQEHISQIRSQAGRKGGAPKGNNNARKDENKQKQAKTSKNKQNNLLLESPSEQDKNDAMDNVEVVDNVDVTETRKQNKQNKQMLEYTLKAQKKEEKASSPHTPYLEKEENASTSRRACAYARDGTTALDRRRSEFYQSLVPYVEKYGKDMIREFYDYWSEENQARTKMRYEMEKTWGLSRRLATWRQKQQQFKQRDHAISSRYSTPESRAADAADIVAQLLRGE